MTIFVTGGAGFIGSNFILNWVENSQEKIINIDKLTYAGNLENLKSVEDNPNYLFVEGDIADNALIESLYKLHQPRALINFAAESHVDRSIHTPQDFIYTNILGTFNLLETSLRFWKALKDSEQKNFRFLHVSTDEVYGSLGKDDHPFLETNSYQPNSPYSASKASSDHLVRAYFHTYGLPVLTTNCSNNYGPFQFPEKLIPLCISNALTGELLPIYGDGMQIRDWLYVNDHCNAINRVLEIGSIGEVYNIGGCNEKTNIDVVKTICLILDELKPKLDGKSYEEQIKFIKDRPGHDRRYAIDARKIQNKLKWNPSETFESGIRNTIQWYLNNQTWVGHVLDGQYRQWIKKQYT